MPRSLTDDQLADKLLSPQIDRTVLDEAARRLKDIEFRQLMAAVEIATAVSQSPFLDKRTAKLVETTALNTVTSRRSSARMSSLAGKILSGREYDHEDVLSLAARVLAQDDD